MTDSPKKRGGKLAICNALSIDLDSLEAYQPTRTKGVYTDGAVYYYAGAKPPEGWEWKAHPGAEWYTKKHGVTVYVAD